jgi:hypothetical protein
MVTVIPQTGSRAVAGAADGAARGWAAAAGRRRRATISVRMLTAISSGVKVEPRRGLQAAESVVGDRPRAERLQHGPGTRRARDQADVLRVAPERLLERVLVEPAVGRHDDGGPRGLGQARV